jgi:hypothetical protein
VAQDRDEISLVIAEWDAVYEYYAIEGILPPRRQPPRQPSPQQPPSEPTQTEPPSTPAKGLTGKMKVVFRGKNNQGKDNSDKEKGKGDKGKGKQPLPPPQRGYHSDSSRSRLGVEPSPPTDRDAGFLTLHVYGTFRTRFPREMAKLSFFLLALSMQLAQVPGDKLETYSQVVPTTGSRESSRSGGSSR